MGVQLSMRQVINTSYIEVEGMPKWIGLVERMSESHLRSEKRYRTDLSGNTDLIGDVLQKLQVRFTRNQLAYMAMNGKKNASLCMYKKIVEKCAITFIHRGSDCALFDKFFLLSST